MRTLAAALLLAACGAGVPMSEAATPTLLWREASALQLLCHVTTRSGRDAGLEQALCARVRDLSAAGAPVPVSVIAPGDPALLAPGAVTLLVQASIEPSDSGRLAALAIRPFRNAGDSGLVFGAPPRAVLVPAGADAGAALEPAVRAILSETLPWLSSAARPRPIES